MNVAMQKSRPEDESAFPSRVAGASTDSHKFEHMGPLRSFLRCLLILVCYQLRLPILGRSFFAAIR